MATIAENLQTILSSTQDIKQAIIAKGGTINGNITTWDDAINAIVSGSGESGTIQPTANLILNKLNGGTIGELDVHYSIDTILHRFNFSDSTIDFMLLLNSGNDFCNAEWFLTQLPGGYEFDSRRFSLTRGVAIYTNASIMDKYLDICIHTIQSTLYNPVSINYLLIAFSSDGFDFDTFTITVTNASCYLKNTQISLSNGMTKKVQDINYNDELLVWNFDEGKFDKAKPLWIKKEEKTNSYYKVTLDNGNTIGLVGSNGKCHRLFNYDDMIFESATELVGKNVHTLNGIHKVVSVEKINELVEYYNIITDFHMNCFANGILTSCRYNNLYPIKDMKFDKEAVILEPKWKVNEEKFKPNSDILPKYVNGMRLNENTTISIEDMKQYITNLENKRKTVSDFNDNELITNIEETEVGWIDKDGNTYGFKLYMPGHKSHDSLANMICRTLGISTANPSKYLEKEGWIKYTNDFVLNSDDEEINDSQIESLKRFIAVPHKLKKEGKIRIGDFSSPYTDVSNLDTLNKHYFEKHKKRSRRF